uniref:Basal cell adhesion molecule n=1 Tax=Lygus hesperus TaxID=30085 RepID=A0A0A9X1U7_LYGHE
MTCIYDLGDSPLCYVKWYRGNFEFYRYTPSENPPHKLFPYPGIHVNIGLSNGTQVVLDGLGLGLSGKVTCEVTTDDAIPQSASLESTLVVHDLPESGPVMVLERTADAYSPGETLRANCSSPPSKPAPILFFIINGNPCGNEGLCERRVVPVSDTLTWSATFLTLHLKPSHFKKGNLNILCKAVINGIYEDQTSIDVKESPVYQVKIGSLRPSSATTLHSSWLCALALFFSSTVMR